MLASVREAPQRAEELEQQEQGQALLVLELYEMRSSVDLEEMRLPLSHSQALLASLEALCEVS